MSLANIKFEVELNDGSLHHITVLNASLVAWDRTRNLRGWPDIQEGKFLWMTFLAWHHMKAAGLVECEFEEFESTVCTGIGDPAKDESEDGDEKAEETVDPIPSPPALVSASP